MKEPEDKIDYRRNGNEKYKNSKEVCFVKKFYKALALTLAICLSAAGCAGGKQAETETEAGGGDTLTYWADLPGYLSSSGMTFNELPMYKEYNKRTGIDVKFIHPPVGQRNEKFNLMIASGNLPDIIEYPWGEYSGGITKAVSDGVVIPLDGFIEKAAPNLFKILQAHPEYQKAATTRDGKYYGFPRMDLTDDIVNISGGLFLRQDWLKKVGMDVPTNMEEWDAVLRAFKNQLGIEKPLVITAGSFQGTTGQFNSAFKVGLDFYLEDGKVTYGPLQPSYKDFIGTFAKWYSDGLLDSEFAVVTADAIKSQVINGETGAFFGWIGNVVGNILAAKKDDSEFKLVGAPFPTADPEDASCYVGVGAPVVAPYGCITKKCKNPELAAKWLDYAYSEEGYILYYYGIEGTSYEMVDGYPTYTDLIQKNPDGLGFFEAWSRYARGYTSCIGAKLPIGTAEQQKKGFRELIEAQYPYQEQIDAFYTFNKNGENRKKTLLPALEYDTDIMGTVSNLKFEVDNYTSENLVRFINGDRPMSEWDAFVNELKSLNIEELLKYMQKSYEEYINK